MRLALAALSSLGLSGCITHDSGGDTYDPPPDTSGWGSGWGGGGGTSGFGCHADSECPTGFVCARNGDCMAQTSVHIVHVNWTVNDQPASEATCTSAPNLDLTFGDAYDQFGFSPVPCKAGRFTVDKMPLRYTQVALARAGDAGGGATSTFDANGDANLDLPY
jgi:hypothetical protein